MSYCKGMKTITTSILTFIKQMAQNAHTHQNSGIQNVRITFTEKRIFFLVACCFKKYKKNTHTDMRKWLCLGVNNLSANVLNKSQQNSKHLRYPIHKAELRENATQGPERGAQQRPSQLVENPQALIKLKWVEVSLVC